MPGALIEANLSYLGGPLSYQVEMNDYLCGDGNPWKVTDLGGLGSVRNDGDRQRASFSPTVASGSHVAEPGAVVFTALCHTGAASTMEEAIEDLEDAWTISAATTSPLELHLLLPSRGHVWVLGWPDQVDVTRVFPAGGVAAAVCTFSRVDVTTHNYAGGS